MMFCEQPLGHFAEVASSQVNIVDLLIGRAGYLLHGVHQSRPADIQCARIGQRKWSACEEDGGGTKILFTQIAQVPRKETDLLQLRCRTGDGISSFGKTAHVTLYSRGRRSP